MMCICVSGDTYFSGMVTFIAIWVAIYSIVVSLVPYFNRRRTQKIEEKIIALEKKNSELEQKSSELEKRSADLTRKNSDLNDEIQSLKEKTKNVTQQFDANIAALNRAYEEAKNKINH